LFSIKSSSFAPNKADIYPKTSGKQNLKAFSDETFLIINKQLDIEAKIGPNFGLPIKELNAPIKNPIEQLLNKMFFSSMLVN